MTNCSKFEIANRGYKAFWEKERMLVTSISFFFPKRFSKACSFGIVKTWDCVGLTLYQTTKS